MLGSEAVKDWAGWLDGFGRCLLATFTPPLCVGCESTLGPTEEWLCRGCRISISSAARPRSRTVPLGGGRLLSVGYALDYDPIVSSVITQMKYADRPGLANVLAPFLDYALAGPLPEGTLIVPVPIHASKRRERGYNQSSLLAKSLALRRSLPVEHDLLVKQKNTVSQAGLEKGDRLRNVAGSFSLRRRSAFRCGSVLLVDDVITTGSTLRECARTLLAAGGTEVFACAVASSQ